MYEKSSQDAKSLVYAPELSEFNSEIESYLSLDVCNSEAVFQVHSAACLSVNLVQKSGNADVTSIIVLVKSRGIVRYVFTETVSAFPHEFEITIDNDMAPNFVVLVSALGSAADSSEKEALPASITIPVQQSPALWPNQVRNWQLLAVTWGIDKPNFSVCNAKLNAELEQIQSFFKFSHGRISELESYVEVNKTRYK